MVEADRPEQASDSLSTDGAPAVMCMRRLAADYVGVSVIPRAHETAPSRIVNERDFHILVYSMNTEWAAMSERFFKKEEALVIGGYFVGLTGSQAARLWSAKKLGGTGVRSIHPLLSCREHKPL